MLRFALPLAYAFAIALPNPAFAQEADAPVSEAAPEEETFEFPTEEEEAMAEFEREMEDAFALFGEIFKVEPLTPEQEALLPLANEMTDVIMPEGTFGVVMQDSMEPMMGAIMGGIASNPRLRLSELTGVDQADLAELEDDTAQEALDIFDPEFSARTERMGDIVVEMVSEMFNAIEPAYREAYARALTTRFDADEMTQLLGFFKTPVGGKFANASFTIQYDPQMLGVIEQMGPAMIEVMPGMMESFATLEADFAKERRYSDLSEAERDRAASLLGKPVAELDALQPADDEAVEAEDTSEFEST